MHLKQSFLRRKIFMFILVTGHPFINSSLPVLCSAACFIVFFFVQHLDKLLCLVLDIYVNVYLFTHYFLHIPQTCIRTVILTRSDSTVKLNHILYFHLQIMFALSQREQHPLDTDASFALAFAYWERIQFHSCKSFAF